MIGQVVIRRAVVRAASLTRQAASSPGKAALKLWKLARKKAQGESLVRLFLLHWRAVEGPALEREVRFDASRRWRFDFAHVASKVAVELEGGVFTNGAHVRGKHFEEDCAKYNAATAQGWRVFRLTRDMIGRVQCTLVKTAIEQKVTKGTKEEASRKEAEAQWGKGPLPGRQG